MMIDNHKIYVHMCTCCKQLVERNIAKKNHFTRKLLHFVKYVPKPRMYLAAIYMQFNCAYNLFPHFMQNIRTAPPHMKYV